MRQFRTHLPAMSSRGTQPESSFAAKRFLFSSIPEIRLAFRLQSDRRRLSFERTTCVRMRFACARAGKREPFLHRFETR